MSTYIKTKVRGCTSVCQFYCTRMNIRILFFLLLCLVSSNSAASSSQQVYYVTPTSPAGTPCPGQPCLTLDQYIASSSTYIISHSVFKLLPGQHDITGSFIARSIECITIEGDSEDKLNSTVQISGTRSRFMFQFINTDDVYISGIELDNVGVSLEGTENVTLHQVVVNGPRTAVSLTNTVDTNISCCTLENTGWTALTLRHTYATSISNTTVNNTRWNGFDFFNASKTEIYHSFINSTNWNGIELRQTNSTLISCSIVNSTGWNGIEMFNVSQTKVIGTLVNKTGWIGIETNRANFTLIYNSTVKNTRWDGIEIYNSSKTSIISTNVNNTRWNGIEVRQANSTVISCSTVNSTGWTGIEIFNSSQVTVNCSLVNASRWDGIEIRNTTQARLIGTNITNARLRSLDCRFTDTPCTIERPPNLDCSCSKEGQCGPVPLNFPTPQTPPPPPSEEPEIDDVETAGSRQVYYVTPTSPAGTLCPGQPCLTLDQYIASSSTYIISHTVFKLLPGQHDITGSFIARSIECITIEGDSKDKLNSTVQISGTRSRYLFQFINTDNVYISGIELDNVGISLEGTENVTLHQVVVNGPRTAVSLTNTVDTNISCCTLENTGWTALTLRHTYATNISNTTVNNTRWNGIEIYNSSETYIIRTIVNKTGWKGIEVRQANSTVISCSTVNSTRWTGIEIFLFFPSYSQLLTSECITLGWYRNPKYYTS